MTTMMGRSISRSSLFVCQPDVPDVLVEIAARQDEARCLPDVVEGVDEAQLFARVLCIATTHDSIGVDMSRGGGGIRV
jgi:hypothetical protein